MVHALQEVWRVLIPNGFLIDLRPFIAEPPVQIVVGNQVMVAGAIDGTANFSKHLNANRAVQEIVNHGWFVAEEQDAFELYTYWDGTGEFKTFMDEESQSILPLETLAEAKRLIASEANARLRTQRLMVIARYRKVSAQ